jgi:apolipoprotein N-acyltransferase
MNDRGPRPAAWACASGFLLALAYPRADAGPLAFLALVPFLLSLPGTPSRAALARGYLGGLSFFTALLYWIPAVMVKYGGMSWPVSCLVLMLLVLYLATYFALFAMVVSMSCRILGTLSLVMTPFLWVGLEIFRGRLLTGFPWGLLGYTQHRNVALLQAASWGGIYAVSFMVMAANAGVALLMLRPSGLSRRIVPAVLIGLVILAHLAGGLVVPHGTGGSPEGEAIPIAAIQGNVPQDLKWDPAGETQILSNLVRMSREAAAEGARLIVWPESSSPESFRIPVRRDASGVDIDIRSNTKYTSLVSGLAVETGATLIVGSVDYTTQGGELRALNSAFVFGPDGSTGASYDKMHLVPFGEYVPLHSWLRFVDRLAQGTIADFAPGTRATALPTPVGPAATFICYEGIFPEQVRRIARGGAVFLVNITNDAWFGTSSAPEQHLAMAVVRSVENRRYMVRAANTGISAIIDPYGRVVARTDLMRTAVLRGKVRPGGPRTIYSRFGDLFGWGCAILAFLHGAALRAAFLRRG